MEREFDILMGIEEDKSMPVMKRIAVRAVIVENEKILMLKSNRGDYKLPGGGVEKNEDFSSALVREIKEETGYANASVKHEIGRVIERRVDSYDDSKLFEMHSYYYVCTLKEEKSEQDLDPYEKALGFEPVWLSMEEAIRLNGMYMKRHPESVGWTKRENLVLRSLLESEGL